MKIQKTIRVLYALYVEKFLVNNNFLINLRLSQCMKGSERVKYYHSGVSKEGEKLIDLECANVVK